MLLVSCCAGVVDYSEFIAFYGSVLHDSRKSDIVFERRRKNKLAREDRAKRALAYVQPDSILGAVQAKSLVLLSVSRRHVRLSRPSQPSSRPI